MKALRVPKRHANIIIKRLIKDSIIDPNFKIKRDEKFVFIPLKEPIDPKIIHESASIIETKFKEKKKRPRDFKEILKDKIEDKLLADIRRSFDIIGDIVILEIPEKLEEYKHLIGEAALKFTKKRGVFRKKSKVKGIERIREFEHLAGENSTETIHVEYSTRIKLDIKKVYFNPRLANERERIARQVKKGETVLDMFAGVGPFSLAIARHKKASKIYAVDINPTAIEYLKENIRLNKAHEIIPCHGDIRKVAEKIPEKVDRIIMNLPASAREFLDLALKLIKDGGIIHYYEFARDFETPIKHLLEAAQPFKVKILHKRMVKSKSPGVWQIAIDAKIQKT
ncbi:MAG: class I SAM-dependent methyltransferase family protein [Methanothermobacter sp.]|nr:class I SAM-dependent methyltransferase family protein [Methanothermobacter sp.]